MNSDRTSVIIVGAGPVGLGLACELGQRGIDCVVIEKRDSAISVPKQSMVSARNMEFCRRWGVAETVRTAVWPDRHPRDFIYLENMRGKELLRVKVPSYEKRDRRDFTPEPACPCPQIYFDPILSNHVRTFPNVRIASNTCLDAFTQNDHEVRAQITDTLTGVSRTLHGHYLVGCDGPAGVVRESLGIAVEGLGTIAHSVNLFFRSADLAAAHDKGWARFYRVIDETGCWAELIPIDGKELWRLTVFDQPLSKADPAFLLDKLAGGSFAYEMLDVSRWERRDHVATSYGRGRVFIAGDAAHECSPTGGIGMHTGLEEVVNLGWKLAAMIEGWGGPVLLASYEIERRPIAVRNVGLATRSFKAIAAIPGWQKGQTGWQVASGWLSVPEHMKLQYCYDDSPVCVPDGSPAVVADPSHFIPTTRPGTRAPHAWLNQERSILDLFGDGFVLLQLGANPPDVTPLLEAAAVRGVPFRRAAIADQAIATLYETRLVLVRPDGHVAWRGNKCSANIEAIVDRVRGAAGHEPSVPNRSSETQTPHAHLL